MEDIKEEYGTIESEVASLLDHISVTGTTLEFSVCFCFGSCFLRCEIPTVPLLVPVNVLPIVCVVLEFWYGFNTNQASPKPNKFEIHQDPVGFHSH